jgi:transposase
MPAYTMALISSRKFMQEVSILILLCMRANLSPGCLIEYLSPYSPDYNPIEQAFSVIKAWLWERGIAESLENANYYKLYCACQIITQEMTWGFYSHSGYF